ncbi:cytochrome P450 714B3-like isoform X4 [Dioscorea cayenensis subsp. rotundata]|uniref:Cytochrome P450 714B3-like isoform X4 n=1 Tax=Dioscorea cayennensis subsp. rotundata TaxID=55577 RepID=A0AB40AGF0_DIOCR|nr:cytochrome P450 714B3-like isoform X4 [Dioscorea cayenensis subsp. rotundata]
MGRMEMMILEIFSSILIGFSFMALYLYYIIWMRPEGIRRKMKQLGISGPPPSSFFSGNMEDIKKFMLEKESPRGTITHDYSVFPHFDHWIKDYGPVFVFTMGNMPIMHANGETWSHQKRIIAPEFYLNKGMLDLMVDSASSLLKLWESRMEDGGVEMEVYEDLRNFSADVISRACFGSDYLKGEEIFSKLRALEEALSKPNLLAEITGFRFIPSKSNKEILKLEREVNSLILEMVEGRKASEEKNLLQAILESAKEGFTALNKKAKKFIVDSCKNIYFAGHETTAVAASWCLLMLALHPEWQDLVHAEVTEVCDVLSLDMQSLQKMKILTMVIQETLRLYPPGLLITRESLKDMKIGELQIPKGLGIYIPVPTLHRDPDIWGPEALIFSPERFAHGVTSACGIPQAYIPFGVGTRTCLGQHFAMLELKIVLSHILARFSVSVSQNYHHSPVSRLMLKPEFGIKLIVKKA